MQAPLLSGQSLVNCLAISMNITRSRFLLTGSRRLIITASERYPLMAYPASFSGVPIEFSKNSRAARRCPLFTANEQLVKYEILLVSSSYMHSTQLFLEIP